jgi:hypothetical protein
MATDKKLNTSYTLDTSDVYITGNLTVQGIQTSVQTTDTFITDKIFTLNNGETLAGVGGGVLGNAAAGIEIDRGTNPNAYLVYNEPTNTFAVSTDGGATFANVLTSFGNVSTLISEIVEDTTPQLGGNLDVQTFSIFSATNNVSIAGNLQLNNTLITPTAVANATVVYAASPAAGTSGVYVINGSAANEELITKRRAFGFSLIL